MPVRYDIEPGTEWLLPYAQRLLGRLKERMARGGLNQLQQWHSLDSGERINVATMFGFDRIALQGVSLFNRLRRHTPAAWDPPYNFRLIPDPAELDPYDRVDAKELEPLASGLKFSVLRNLSDPGFPMSASQALTQFRDHVRARSIATRYWFEILVSYVSMVFHGRTMPAQATALRVSEPDPQGNFYLLWGFWDTPRDDLLHIIPPNDTAPREERFNGLIVSWADIEKQISNIVGFALNFDLPPETTNGYHGPQLVGRTYDSDVLIEQGLDYRREEAGFFPKPPAFGAAVEGTKYTHVYRPDGDGLGWPFVMAQFVQRGLQGVRLDSGSVQTWSYDFKLHKLGQDGSIIVENAVLPRLAQLEMTISYPGFGTNNQAQETSAFDTDAVFFDGEKFVKLGTHSQTASLADPQDIPGVGDPTVFIPGQYTFTSSLEQTLQMSGGFGPTISFTSLLPDYSMVYSQSAPSDVGRIMPASEYGNPAYVHSEPRSASFGALQSPLLPLWLQGPSWGTYALETDFLFRTSEQGFHVVGYAGLVPTMASFAPQLLGAYWYRRAAPMGVFLFRRDLVVPESDWAGDCLKYRNIYLGVEGYRVGEPKWEELDDVLARIVSGIKVDVNNFASMRLIPWIQEQRGFVIVEH